MSHASLQRMRCPRERGFTLIELVAVLAIMGVLSMMVMPLGETLVRARKERELKTALWEIREALDRYKWAVEMGRISPGTPGSGYPPDLTVLVEGVPTVDRESGGMTHLVFLRRIPRDPFAALELAPGATWRLRSYVSSAQQPEPGDDVYDVRSSSDDIALDGSRYADW